MSSFARVLPLPILLPFFGGQLFGTLLSAAASESTAHVTQCVYLGPGGEGRVCAEGVKPDSAYCGADSRASDCCDSSKGGKWVPSGKMFWNSAGSGPWSGSYQGWQCKSDQPGASPYVKKFSDAEERSGAGNNSSWYAARDKSSKFREEAIEEAVQAAVSLNDTVKEAVAQLPGNRDDANPVCEQDPRPTAPAAPLSDQAYLAKYLGPIPSDRSDPDAGLKGYWRKVRCDELLSENPPDWVSQPGRPLLSYDNYWPVCSLSRMHTVRTKYPGASLNEVASLANSEFLRNDRCAGGGSDDPGVKTDASPTAPKRPPLVMDDQKQKEVEASYVSLREAAATACCKPEESECLAQMRSVGFQWCAPQLDTTQPDSCAEIGKGGKYVVDSDREEQLRFFQNYQTPQAGAGHFPIRPGYFLFSPYRTASGREYINPSSIEHELGHACSRVRRQLAVNSGADPDAYAQFESSMHMIDVAQRRIARGCELSEPSLRVYQKLFAGPRGSDMAPETWTCLQDMARGAILNRFNDAPCEMGCPLMYLEETFGNWMSFRNTPESARIPALFPLRACKHIRDNTHPFNQDQLKCFLKTPAFATLVKGTLGCQP